MHIYMCMCVCVCTYYIYSVSSLYICTYECKCPQRTKVLDPLDLELSVVVSLMMYRGLETTLGSLGRASSALNHITISPAANH